MKMSAADIPLRPPNTVMRLKRLGSFHQCRLSFMRVLTRRMALEHWKFSRPKFAIDENGVGSAVYTATGPERAYSLVAFAHDLPADKRSDRVIAEAWDATFALFDGVPEPADIERLSQNVPFQESGRIQETELTLSRANRSVRLWSHVVDSLAAGRQPAVEQIDAVGYLMRTTAVYGSGKFGAADRETIAGRPEFSTPFQAEMLTVYLIRSFVRDLVQHMAHAKGGSATVDLAEEIATRLGVGNSTGLGMAPFLINHPVLFNNWILAREKAIASVRSLKTANDNETELFRTILSRSERSIGEWNSVHPKQIEKLKALRRDIELLKTYIAKNDLHFDQPWNRLYIWSEHNLSEEGQEFVASLILEPFPQLIDSLALGMSDNDTDAFQIDGAMPVSEVQSFIASTFGWAFELNWDAAENCARAWYVSEEKFEPRLGERFHEPVSAYEQPLAPARDATAAFKEMNNWPPECPVAEFLLAHPEHRHTVRRAQIIPNAPYGEIRDNTISADILPIDMLRAKLSFFGATHFDPRSDRWVRICMYSGAPYPQDLTSDNADLWIYPEVSA